MTWAFMLGVGGGNRSRAISMGSATVRAAGDADQAFAAVLSIKAAPRHLSKWPVNGLNDHASMSGGPGVTNWLVACFSPPSS